MARPLKTVIILCMIKEKIYKSINNKASNETDKTEIDKTKIETFRNKFDKIEILAQEKKRLRIE